MFTATNFVPETGRSFRQTFSSREAMEDFTAMVLSIGGTLAAIEEG